MTARAILKLRHTHRGSWLAKAGDARTRTAVGEESIAVLRDWENGLFDWRAKDGPTLSTTAEQIRSENAAYWWMRPEHETWRTALSEGAIVWVRQAIEDGTVGGSVGRSKGVWRIGDVRIDDTRLFLRLKERIGDVRS